MNTVSENSLKAAPSGPAAISAKKPGPGLGEEIANSITHGIGALLSVAATVILVVLAAQHGSAWHVVSFAIFGFSSLMLYSMSTLYHALTNQRAKRVFKVLDHSAIFFLIAGTYTPFTLTILRPTVGWWIFGLVWGVAALGIALKPFLVGRWRVLSTLVYVALGWVVVFAWQPLQAAASPETIRYLILGGVLYTAGAGFYIVKNTVWSHPVWHGFVGAGTIMHFFSILSLLG